MHRVQAKGILSAQNGMNIYRGCTHGCIYCDSRSLCYGMNHPFEDVEVKENAPALLEAALRRRRSRCMIGTGAMSDPYLPLERELELTKRCLEVIEGQGFGATLLTKSDLILRDLPLLGRIRERAKCVVQLTLTTLDEALCRVIEPNVCPTSRRVEVLRRCREMEIPTVVWLSPILPYINDTEENLRGLLELCVEEKVKGILCFGMGMTLRAGNREYYYAALERHFPGLRERYIRDFGERYQLLSPNNARLMDIFRETCRAAGILYRPETVFAYLRELPEPYVQSSLF